MTLTLLSDISSYCKDRTLYGKAGDKVKLISDLHGSVLIVENKKGGRFAIDENKTSQIYLK